MSLLETPTESVETENVQAESVATEAPEATEVQAEVVSAETETVDLLGGKYKTAGDLAAAYSEQSKYIGELRKNIKDVEDKYKVPDNYDFNFEEGGQLEKYKGLSETLDLPYLADVFKKNGLNKEQAEGVLESYLESIEASKVKPEDELLKLGHRKEQVLGELNNYKKGLNEADQKILDSMATTGEALDFLHRNLVKEKLTIPSGNVSAVSKQSAEELLSEARKYQKENGHLFEAYPAKQEEYLGKMRKYFQAAGIPVDN
jgi:hypothetical protein